MLDSVLLLRVHRVLHSRYVAAAVRMLHPGLQQAVLVAGGLLQGHSVHSRYATAQAPARHMESSCC